MTITSVPSKMQTINKAIGFEKFKKELNYFMGINNLAGQECILHILNSFYFMSPDLNRIYQNDNDTAEDKAIT